MNNIELELELNRGIKIVNSAKELEKNGSYDQAATKYKEAIDFFKKINQYKLSAQCQAAYVANRVKNYLGPRDIEPSSTNWIDTYIKILKKIGSPELSKSDEYDILISTYRELEQVFQDSHMLDKANDMYYKRTSLYHKFYRQRAMQKGRKCREKIMDNISSFINVWLFIFCGHGEKPWRAVGGITFFILSFSILFKYCKLLTGKSFWQSLYFSVVTFTTLGYGDILPIGTAGQIAVIAEVIFGVLSLGLLLATLTRRFTK
jgi:tetratricopeptide (TPR) repeat protein